MAQLTSLIHRHGRKGLLIAAIAAATPAVLIAPQLQARANSAWETALAWAGFGTGAHDSETIYWCPMHPQIKRTNANEVCPICSMALVPLEGGAKGSREHLTLSARQIQQAGVATQPVIRRKLYREIDTTGRIVTDERRLAKITSWVRGKSRIEKLYIDFTGAAVRKGDLMAELYSPELIVAQEEFLLTLQGPRISGMDLVASARQRLRDQGMTDEQIDELQQTKKVLNRIPIVAPLGGTVFERKVQQGQYVEEGDLLFQIADLHHLWLFADVYEEELPFVSEGQSLELSVRSFPGEKFEGHVVFIDPMVQPDSRTVRVRIHIPNPDGRLKPGMYARARLRADLPEMLAVPESAVLWSGQRQVALVKQGDGEFQPREIQIGQRWLYASKQEYVSEGQLEFGSASARYHEVLGGLYPGEEVVTSGAFLLSAESQFQSVLTKMLPPLDQSATLEEAIGEERAKGVRKLLAAYFDLSKTLADDQLEAVPDRFAAVGKAAETLAQQAQQDGARKLAHTAHTIAARAQAVSQEPPKDLREARTDFGRLSRSTVQLLAENGGQTLFGRELFLFHCGMAKVGYENWLWWSDEKLNPYMGQKMLDCGTKLTKLEP